jgi:hypothetical protein
MFHADAIIELEYRRRLERIDKREQEGRVAKPKAAIREGKRKARLEAIEAKATQKRRWRQERRAEVLRMRAYHKAKNAELREEILTAYGSRCVCCGEIEPLF